MSRRVGTTIETCGRTRRFDRVLGIRAADADLRADLLDTAMLRPLGFVTASLGFLMMSVTTLWTVRTPWAALWLGADLLLLLVRLVPAVGPWRERKRVSERVACIILVAASVMFSIFGLGCMASFLTGVHELQVASSIAVMGLLTGLATRWAGLPRLAGAMILVVSLPMVIAIGMVFPLAATLFAVLAAGTAVLTMQNNRTLVAMLRAERTARSMAITDPLTGLLNRSGFDAAMAAHEGRLVTLVCLDLDGFKSVNDQHGHAAGDVVLSQIGERLRALTIGLKVARLGGDEFVIIRSGVEMAYGMSISQAVRQAVGQPIEIDTNGTQVRVGVSSGIACGPVDVSGGASLLAEADRALYEAKRSKRSPRETESQLAGAA